jgi:hypothetical protein
MSDFSGVLTLKAPSATAANNAAGNIVVDQVSSNTFLSLGPVLLNGTTAQNDIIGVVPMFPVGVNKIMINVPKTAGATWTRGQSIYLITATGIFITTSGTGKVLFGIATDDAASADTVGNILPCQPR